MNEMKKFIDGELVHCNYWLRYDAPETAARKCIESVLYLHYYSNSVDSAFSYTVGLNLESLLRVMINHYLYDSTYRLTMLDILNRAITYTEEDIKWILDEIYTSNNMWVKLIYGCILKVFVPYKPDMQIITDSDQLLFDLSYIMSKSRLKKTICNPDSEIHNDQFGATDFLDKLIEKNLDDDIYSQMYRVSLTCDIIILAYIQRTAKFKHLYSYFKRLCIKDFLTEHSH